MDVQRPAATLALGNHNLAAVSSQNPQRRLVELRKRQIGNTSCYEGHPVAARPDRRHNRSQTRKEKGLFHPGRKPRQRFEVSREHSEQSGGKDSSFQARALIEAQKPAENLKSTWVGQEIAEEDFTQKSCNGRTAIIFFDLPASGFDQPTILNT